MRFKLFVTLLIISAGCLFLYKTTKSYIETVVPKSYKQTATIKKTITFSSENPGEVPNIFGWGYERSVCQIPDGEIFVTFFFAQDNHIHYVFSNNLKKVFTVPSDIHQNPDFDVICDKDTVTVIYSNDSQFDMYAVSGEMRNDKIAWQKIQIVGENSSSFSMVAPSGKIINGNLYISYMSFGLSGADSKVSVVNNINGKWNTPEQIFSFSSKQSQVIGNSMEEFSGNPFIILSPPVSETRFSILSNGEWPKPVVQSGMSFFGQLEWNSITTDSGIYLLYRGRNAIIYSFISSLDNKIFSIPIYKNPATLNFSLFLDKNNNIYSIAGRGEVRQLLGEDGISKSQYVFSNDHPLLTWLRVPEKIYSDSLPVIWLSGGYPDYQIHYTAVDLSRLKKFEKDETINLTVTPLAL